ncbi:hypothetical protein D3C80_1519570 [compost metagenome]
MRSTMRLLASMEIISSGGSALSGMKEVIVRPIRSPAWAAVATATVKARLAIESLNSRGEIMGDAQVFSGICA